MIRPLAALAAGCLATILLTAAALAQTVSTGSLLLDAFRPVLVEIVVGICVAALGYALKLLRDKAGIELEASHRAALQAALTNAAGLLISRLGGSGLALRLGPADPGTVEGVDYVLRSAPDAVKHFGLEPAEIAEKLTAKIGVLAAPARH